MDNKNTRLTSLISIFFKNRKKGDYTKNNIKQDTLETEEFPFISSDMQMALSNSIQDIKRFKLQEEKYKLLVIREGLVKLTMASSEELASSHYNLSSFMNEPVSISKTKGYVVKK